MTEKERSLKGRIDTIEANIIEQEHRLFTSLVTFFRRKQWPVNSPKRLASLKALIWNLIPKPGPVAVLVTIISLVTVYMAYQANLKIDNQNILLTVQNELQESQRRSSLNIEISAIMDVINKEREAGRLKGEKDKDHNRMGHKVAPYTLNDVTSARIAAISRSLKPYRSLVVNDEGIDHLRNKNNITSYFLSLTPKLDIVDFLDPRIHSPEREQLFIALQTMRISFQNIGANADFSYMILDGINLSRSDFRTISMNNSLIRGCALSYAIFDDGKFQMCNFNESSGTTVSFMRASLAESTLMNCKLNTVNFEEADLKNANFSHSDLLLSNFKSADVSGCNFTGANLSGSDFEDLTYEGTNFKYSLIEDIVNAPEGFEAFAIKNGAFSNSDEYYSYKESLN